METYNIGKIIRETRTRRNISQEELSDGICSPVTLSRIENGMQKPSLKIEAALLERLGYHAENPVVYADEWLYNEEVLKFLEDYEFAGKRNRTRMYGTPITRKWMDSLGIKEHYYTKDGTQVLEI